MKVYINEAFVEANEAKISVFDHGLLYGDGIFEGIRLYEGCVFKLEEHLERLEYSAKTILLSLPWSRQKIAEAVCETCRINGLRSGYIRLIVTRGKGSLGLSPYSCRDPQLIIIADNIQLYSEENYEKGLKIITVPTRRVNAGALPPMVKSLNYLNNIMAKIEALHSGYQEALMLNDQGYIAECTGDNIFIIHKGRAMSPPSTAGALLGITRGSVINMIEKEGELDFFETNLTRYDLWNAEECFLTGTAAEVIPVVELDGRQIGEGRAGPHTKKLMQLFRKQIVVDGTHL